MRRHGVRHGVVLATAFATTLLIAPLTPQPVTAQHASFCRTEKALENRLRRVRGRIMVECGNECPVWPLPFCHSAPFGNWGVDSKFGPTTNRDQFRGWKNLDGHGQWNSCTANYRNDFNDGPGRQKAAPDDPEFVASDISADWTACSYVTPEVHTERNVEMVLYELDWDGNDHITTLEYGDIDVQITCSNIWHCRGESPWRRQRSSDLTRVTAEARITYTAAYSSF